MIYFLTTPNTELQYDILGMCYSILPSGDTAIRCATKQTTRRKHKGRVQRRTRARRCTANTATSSSLSPNCDQHYTKQTRHDRGKVTTLHESMFAEKRVPGITKRKCHKGRKRDAQRQRVCTASRHAKERRTVIVGAAAIKSKSGLSDGHGGLHNTRARCISPLRPPTEIDAIQITTFMYERSPSFIKPRLTRRKA